MDNGTEDPLRTAIRRHIDSKHCTLYGQAFVVKGDGRDRAGLEEAVSWFYDEFAAVMRLAGMVVDAPC